MIYWYIDKQVGEGGIKALNKSVYSLVLMDKVVEEVDKLAYSMNTSRSNLINQILAERVCCVTPENRMRMIFDYVNKLMDGIGSFKVQTQPSDSMISIRSILSYKYNPTIRYSIELYRNSHPVMGKLKVSLRTQSSQLINSVSDAFNEWKDLEERYACRYLTEGSADSEIDNGKYVRRFRLQDGMNEDDEEQIGEAIARYVEAFDMGLKSYFAYQEDEERARLEMERSYLRSLEEGLLII